MAHSRAALGERFGSQTSYQLSFENRVFGTPRGGRRTVPSLTPSSGVRGVPSLTIRIAMVALGKTSNGCEDQPADGSKDREQSKGGEAADQRPVSCVLTDQEDENQDEAVDDSGDYKLLFVFITQHDAGNAPGHKRPPAQEEGMCRENAEDRGDDGGFDDDG